MMKIENDMENHYYSIYIFSVISNSTYYYDYIYILFYYYGEFDPRLCSKENPQNFLHSLKLDVFDYIEHVVNYFAKFETSLSPFTKGTKGGFTFLYSSCAKLIVLNQGCSFKFLIFYILNSGFFQKSFLKRSLRSLLQFLLRYGYPNLIFSNNSFLFLE